MKDLSLGSKILDTYGSYSDVFLFSHQDTSDKLYPFVQLIAEDGSVLTASAGHYVHTPAGFANAGSVVVGTLLVKGDGCYVAVADKSVVNLRGLFNPQTLSGSLIVDSFAVSAYTTGINPQYAHNLLTPIRVLYSAMRSHPNLYQLVAKQFAKGVDRTS
jgi:Hint module